MCLPGALQPMQVSLPHTGLGYNERNKFLNSSRGLNTFSTSEETLMQSAYNLSNSCNISNRPTILGSVSDISTSEAALGFEKSIQALYRPFNLPASSKVTLNSIKCKLMTKLLAFLKLKSSVFLPEGNNNRWEITIAARYKSYWKVLFVRC